MPETRDKAVMRGLIRVWNDFSSRLDRVSLIDKLLRGKFRMEDYKLFLVNHRQQVIDGSRWIARAGSSFDERHLEIRSRFIRHAVTEHRDYAMLEEDYVSVGGRLEDIRNGQKNIGSEALSAYMMHHASQPNPLHLLGAMFIIEGLGRSKAGEWGGMIREQLNLRPDQVSFLLYHGAHDGDHMEQFEQTLVSGILDIDGLAESIVKTAKVTALLYRLQIEEIGNV